MTRGLETAFWGTLGKDPELKTSKAGTPYAGMNVVVVTGTTDDGKDVSQWLRVTCFGDTAKAIASRAKKGDRVYVEGTLTMSQWNDAQGEVRHGLNVTAWKVERVASIGKNRPPRQDNGTSTAYRKPGAGHVDKDLNDEMPF
jgi:single-strand DNA-binding protein